jgi:hypothetical protein
MMKLLLKTMFLILLQIPLQSHCQKNNNKFLLKLGYGYYQGINTGLNYFYEENRNLGIGFGSYFSLPPLENEKHFNILIENNILFGKHNKQEIKPWIFNQQLMYWEQGSPANRWKTVSLGLHIGRSIAFKKNLGLALEGGMALNLFSRVKRDPDIEPTGWMWPVLYNWRAQFYYLF